ASLSTLYNKPAFEPPPAQLVAFVRNYGSKGRPVKAPSMLRLSATPLRSWWQFFPQRYQWQMAAAAGAILLLGGGLGWMSRSILAPKGGERLVNFDKGHLFAAGTLEAALEAAPSGQETRIGGVARDAVTMRVNLTFKDKDQRYCREYEVVAAAEGSHAGLACR